MSSIASASGSMLNGAASVVNLNSNRSGIKSMISDSGAVAAAYANSTSPLQIFVRAKKKINDIFQEIEEYVGETTTFVEGED